jgi:hypothetical protein
MPVGLRANYATKQHARLSFARIKYKRGWQLAHFTLKKGVRKIQK